MTTTSASTGNGKATIVLVHGAFADGSGWAKVIPLLEKEGHAVIAVQNPLTSYADDVATTRRVIDAQKGPVVAVGHSYGGAVITGAASGNANVKALVYIAAFAPDSNETIGELLERFAPSLIGPALVPDSAGFLYIDRAKFADVFAKDVPETERHVMAATQKPIQGSAFGASVATPAWKSIPAWYLVATEDHAITPELQRFMAQRMGAKTSEVKASHVPFVSQPKTVASVIEQAASAVAQ